MTYDVCTPFVCPCCGERGTTDGKASTVKSPALDPATVEALGYATRLLEHFVAEHFPHNPDWKPLPDLIGVLAQLDNATTIAREYKEKLALIGQPSPGNAEPVEANVGMAARLRSHISEIAPLCTLPLDRWNDIAFDLYDIADFIASVSAAPRIPAPPKDQSND